MEGCNEAAVPVLLKLKLTEEKKAQVVDGTLYKQIVGSLRFLCTSRPDLSFGVGLISRFMHDPRTPHMAAAKHILRYLKSTTDWGIFFPKADEQNEVVLEAFSDSDWCGDKVERRSTYGYLFRYLDALISWCSKKYKVVALSSCEAEYIAASEVVCQSLWLEVVLEELKLDYKKLVQLNIDNKSAINLSKNPTLHGRSKHIEMKFHFLRDQVSRGKLTLLYCHTEEQTTDVFTKPLKQARFDKLRKHIGMSSLEFLD